MYTEVIWFALRQSGSLETFFSSLLCAVSCSLPRYQQFSCFLSCIMKIWMHISFSYIISFKKASDTLYMLITYHVERLRREQQGLYLNFLDKFIRSWSNGKCSTVLKYTLPCDTWGGVKNLFVWRKLLYLFPSLPAFHKILLVCSWSFITHLKHRLKICCDLSLIAYSK